MTKRRDWGTGSVYQRKSDGRWMACINAGYLPNGTRRRITMSAKTEAEVRRKLRDMFKKSEAERKAQGDHTTVKAYAEKWLRITENEVRPSTRTTDVGAVNKWIIPIIGRRRLTDLGPDDVRAIAAAIKAAGLSSTTARSYQGVLIRMLNSAVLDGHDIPVRIFKTKKAPIAVSDRLPLTTPQALLVIEQAVQTPGGSRWVLALLQGMRQGEALGLTWDAIDFDRGIITLNWQLQTIPYVDRKNKRLGHRIPDGYEARQLVGTYHLVRPKTKKGFRVIPMVPWAAQALREWRDQAPPNPYGLVWTTPLGRPIPIKDDTEAWQALQEAAGIAHPNGRPFHVHEARHTTATLLMELGVSESVRTAIMGHSSIAVTHGYEYASTQEALYALEQAAARLQLIPRASA